MAWRQSPGGSEQHLTRAAAATRTRTQRPGKHLAVHASESVVKPDFQILRRYRRPLPLRLEHTHRPTLEDYVHRATRLGSSRSLNLRIGINLRDMASWASTSIAGEGSETSVVCSLHWRRIVIANWATGAARAAGCAKYFCSRTCAIRRRCIAELPPSKRGSDAERWRSCAN